MNTSQRRSGFRLPWSGEPSAEPPGEKAGTQGTTEVRHDSDSVAAPETAPSPVLSGPAAAPSADVAPSPTMSAAADSQSQRRAPDPEPSKELLRDLVEAMRGVAEEARAASLTDLRTEVDERIARLADEAEEHGNELRSRAEADIAGIGDWAKAEAERIRSEAEGRVAKRRQRLETQLGADAKRAERETEETSARVAEFERELDSFFVQLTEIADPSAFAAAVKRMPRAPHIATGPSAKGGNGETPIVEGTPATPDAAHGNGALSTPAAETAGTDSELAGRLAELDTKLEAEPSAPADGPVVDTISVIIVKGLGSFGAVTAFKQTLQEVEGIESVTLSLGPTGEFAYRAAHKSNIDLEGAIGGLDGGSVERQPDGALRLTMSRGR